MKIGISRICSAMKQKCVGSQVRTPIQFLKELERYLVKNSDILEEETRVPGQHYIMLPQQFYPLVRAGVAPRAGRGADDYIIRKHRGEISLYLKGIFAEDVPIVSLGMPFYTIAAYIGDPQVDMSLETFEEDVTHVLVALHASSDDATPYAPKRLVSNLAGGNKEAEKWSKEEIQVLAKQAIDYWTKWSVVAD